MKVRQRVQKADAAAATTEDGDAATHRLTGIQVKEVSIVDRAANKRKYLLVKDDDKANDSATGSSAEKATPTNPDQPPTPPTQPGPPATPQAPTLRISPELKTQVIGILKTVLERVGVINKVLEGSSETPGAAAPPELMTALNQLAQMISQAAAPTAPPAAPPPGAPPPAPPPSAAKTEEKPADAEKAGRKISAGRLQQLTTIREALSTLITDVSAAEPGEGEGDGAEGGGEPAAAPPAQGAEKSAPPATELTTLTSVVSSLAEQMGNMTKIFEQQNQRIDQLSKSRGASRQADLDIPTVPRKAEKVIWDMDMAKPLKHID